MQNDYSQAESADSVYREPAPKQKEPRKPDGPGPQKPGKAGPNGRGRSEVMDPCRVPPATPYLVIRSWPSDPGLRPVAPTDVATVSFSPDLAVPVVVNDQGVPGSVLRAWVSNLGLGPAAPVEVKFFLAAPSLSFPPADLTLYATEYTVVRPQSSVLVEAPPVGGVLTVANGASLVVQCTTPLDPRSDTTDPRVDRHVGVLSYGHVGINPGSGGPLNPTFPIDFSIVNRFSSPIESTIEVSIERLRVAASDEEDVLDAVLRYGEREPDLALHLEFLVARGVISKRRSRRILRSSTASSVVPRSLGVRRSAAVSSADFVAIDAELSDTSRRIFPAGTAANHAYGEPVMGAMTLNGLPSKRQQLVEGIRLEPFETRSLTFSAHPRGELGEDEVMVLHLFHVGHSPVGLLGRYAVVLSPQLNGENNLLRQ